MTLLVIHEENEPQTENPLRGVAYPLTKDPFTGTVFVFRSRKADRLKLIKPPS